MTGEKEIEYRSVLTTIFDLFLDVHGNVGQPLQYLLGNCAEKGREMKSVVVGVVAIIIGYGSLRDSIITSEIVHYA
jgi:hypothetical protein